MAGPASVLREIHRLRCFAKDLQAQIDRGPRALKAQDDKVARHETILKEELDGIKKLKVTNHEKETTLRTNNQQIAKHEKQRNEAGGKKEYDALQAEIDSDKAACAALEDEILNAMAEVDERTAKVPELDKAIARAKEELAEFRKNYDSRQEDLASQLKQAQDELTKIEAGLPADIRPQYDRLSAAMGEDALSSVQGRTCVACYTDITAQNYNELLQGRFVPCKSCGRFLYLSE
jgi:uncharacterized protein